MTDDEIIFFSKRQPFLADGKYTLEMTLDISKEKHIEKTYARTYTFTLSGERSALKAADIRSVFPPAGSLGDHSDVLPHIIMNRNTLPWERKADINYPDVPWLALLLFDEKENPIPQVITLDELWKQGIYTREPGEEGKDEITVIDVSVDLLRRILPAADELACLAHVRAKNGSEVAVVAGNRLPRRGSTSTVHLVSMEGLYKAGGFDYGKFSDPVRLISLYSWHFSCEEPQQDFKNLLTHLSFHALRLPDNKQTEAEKYLAMGCAPLQHTLRKGDTTFSWYHGPLVPGGNTTPDERTPSLPVLCADQLYLYNKDLQMFDVSYAAAWELGRLLALQNKTFSAELFTWKRSQAQQLRQAQNQSPDLPYDPPPASPDLPSTVTAWFDRCARLEGIPFNYLVPDEQLLPEETIAFFFMDWLWLDCFRDGALSIGRLSKSDCEWDSAHAAGLLPRLSKGITGFLLRSEVVAGWPGLLVDGYMNETDHEALRLLRMDRLSKNILLCLFEGEVNVVDFQLKPETMHFSLETAVKELKVKVPEGGESKSIATIERRADDNSVISIVPTNGSINSAQFAAAMIETVEKIRLKK